jgi:hypothetical protein
MATAHAKYHFSVTVQTADVAVLHCLRGLCQHWAGGPYPQMGWGGSDLDSWRSGNGKVVFRFASAAGRSSFVADANRLLGQHWQEVTRSDSDPASPRR